MHPVRRHLLMAACVAGLLCAGFWMAATLRAPDPRARGSWGAAPLTIDDTPADVELYLPGCPVAAIVVRADPTGAPARTLMARVTPRDDTGRGPLTGDLRVTFDAHGRATIPLVHSPRRERVVVRLTGEATPLTLDTSRPFELDRGAATSWLGLLPCAVNGSSWTLLALTASVCLGLVGMGWLAAGLLDERAPFDALATYPRGAAALAAAVGMTAVLTYLIVVPPFEPPDELAHVQYARFVATTGALPRTVPAPDSEWRGSVYEWVQQPLYYMVAAGLLRIAGQPDAAPAPVLHPQSRLSGGPDVNIYRHPDTSSPPAAVTTVWLLRWLSVAMAFATLWCAARAVAMATGDVRLAMVATAAVGLVPQWGAVMGIVSTDPPATLAAAVATLLVFKAVQSPSTWYLPALAGLVVGLAYATKVTSVFLVPMMAVALWGVARHAGVGQAFRHAAWIAGGLFVGAAWVPLRAWVVFGDPLARAFKRDVLEIGGFQVVDGPPVLSLAFAQQLQTMVFEAFWARFGSLGAGPLPGTRLWWIYAVASVGLLVAFGIGATSALRVLRRSTWNGADWMVASSTAGVVAGVGLWAWVNLVPQADVIVHWTPRHILPLTVPLLVVVASGTQRLFSVMPVSARLWLRRMLALGLLVLALTGVAVLRSVVLGFHFGY